MSMPITIYKKLNKTIKIKNRNCYLTVTYSDNEHAPYNISINSKDGLFNIRLFTSKLEEVPSILLQAKADIERQIEERNNNTNNLINYFNEF